MKIGAGGRKIERFRIFNMEFMLGKMSRSRYRIVRRIRGGNNQIYIRNIIRQFRQGVTPKQVIKNSVSLVAEKQQPVTGEPYAYVEPEPSLVADPVVQYMNRKQLEKAIERTKKQMMEAAKKLDFIEAAQYRDELLKLEELLKEKS